MYIKYATDNIERDNANDSIVKHFAHIVLLRLHKAQLFKSIISF